MVDIIRVALEPSLTFVPSVTGIARYSDTLPGALQEVAREGGIKAEIVVVGHPRVLKSIRYGALRKGLYLLWLNCVFPWWLLRNRIDVVHYTNFLAPILLKTTRTIITLHDMRYRRLEGRSRFYRWYRDVMIRRSCEQSDAIITISQCSADDIANQLGVDPDKIHAIYLGLDEVFQRKQIAEGPKSAPEKYLLMVGPLYETKNHIVALRAFSVLLKSGYPYPMIIAGEKAYEYRNLYQYVLEQGMQGRVEFLGYVPKNELPSLYRNAHLFLFPSVMEGFGYPLVEAMAMGAPVIASDIPVSREIAGSAAVYAQSGNELDWCVKIRAFDDEQLYQKHVQLGLSRSATFTLRQEARETLEVYLRVSGRLLDDRLLSWAYRHSEPFVEMEAVTDE